MRLLALALPFLQVSLAATYTISHRLLQPTSDSDPTFQKYGTISIPDDSPSILRIDRSESGGAGVGVSGALSGEWYQVLVTGEDLGEGIMSSTKGVRPHPSPINSRLSLPCDLDGPSQSFPELIFSVICTLDCLL